MTSSATDSGAGEMKLTQYILGRGDSICRRAVSGPSVGPDRGMRADGPG